MTERLYYDNAYLTEFDAQVLACRENGSHYDVLLDRSAFYPTSGGQPFDTGTLGSDGVHLVSVFFYSGCFKLMLEWLKNDIPMTPKEVAHLMIRVAEENFIEKL